MRLLIENEKIEIFASAYVGHVHLKFGSDIPHALTLPYITQQAPMKLKLAEGVTNPMR